MIWQAIISGNWRINFGTVSMVRIQVNVFLSGPIQNQSTMEANKRYMICSSCLRFSRVCNPIIQTKLAQTDCCSYVYLKVKWNVFWQGLSFIVLSSEKKKHDLTSVKSKPSKVISNYFRDPPQKWYDPFLWVKTIGLIINCFFKSMYIHTLFWTQNALEYLSL